MRRSAVEIKEKMEEIHILVNNAGELLHLQVLLLLIRFLLKFWMLQQCLLLKTFKL